MNPKTVQFQYDINRMDAVNLVATIHIDDYDTRFLEVLLCERGGAFDVSGSTAAARFVTLAGELLNDSVPCTVEGNAVTVPVDAAAVKSQACTLKIEINLTKDGKVLTLPFPLFVRVRGSILDDAQITPESEGTIPDLLKAAQQALDAATAAIEAASDYENMDNKPQINGVELVGDQTASDLGLQDKLTAGTNITIDENGVISAQGGSSNYNNLTNKPTINGKTLRAYPIDNDSDYLGLQKKLFGDIQESEIDRAIEIGGSKDSGFYSLLGSNDVFNGSVLFQYKFRGYYPITGSTYGQYSSVFYQFKFPRINTNGEVTEPPMYRISVPNVDGSGEKIVTNWQEIGGGSEIASAAVNRNGTITFYDKDGNPLFTTSDEKIVTSGNQQISMGYDNGGFYFLFDDGQEVVNNGSN